MEYIDTIGDYKVYRNKNGYLEGYKTKGEVDNAKQQTGSGIDKVITTCTTTTEFAALINKPVKLKTKTEPPPTLFP